MMSRTVRCVACSLIAIVLNLLLHHVHAAAVRTVAFTGQQAPGKPDGVVFSFFDRPVVLNNAGQTAFQAGTSDDPFNLGIWSEGGGSLNLAAAVGQQAPGLPDGVTYIAFNDPRRVVIGNDGTTAYTAFITSSTPSLWSSGPGGSAMIARNRDQAVGAPAGTSYLLADYGAHSLRINDAGQTAFSSDLVSGTNVVGRGVWSQRNGTLELVTMSGEHAPGTEDGVNFLDNFFPQSLALNKQGQTAFKASLTGPNSQSIWSEGSGSLALVARQGDPAPGMPDGSEFFNVGSGIGQLGFNAAGQVAFGGSVIGGGVDITNDNGIWVGTEGNLSLAVRSGDQAPGVPIGLNLAGLHGDTPALNDAGQIAFFGRLVGPGITSTNNRGIWSGTPGSLSLVARTGDHAPGTEDGVVFGTINLTPGSTAARTLMFNAAGQTAFLAFLTGNGIDVSNSYGIWATDRDGVLQLIERIGDPLEVAPGDVRTIRSLVFLGDQYANPTGNGDGRPSAFNNKGQIAFQASFVGGGQGIFVSNAVAVPEPATIVLSAAALSLCLARRRGTIIIASLLIAAVVGLQTQSVRADSAVAWGNFPGDGSSSGGSPSLARRVTGMDYGVTGASAGGFHSLVIQNGGAFAWGINSTGQLGDGTTTLRLSPTPVVGLMSGVTAVAAGGPANTTGHSLAVQNGAAYAWGYNTIGQLGDGTHNTRLTPVAVVGMESGTTAVSAGELHSLAVQSGRLYAWGSNGNGQLGDGSPENFRNTPVAVIAMEAGVTAISAGGAHSLAVKDGGVYAWGSNQFGQLGHIPFSLENSTPLLVAGLESGATAVAAGHNFSVAAVNGFAYFWGGSAGGVPVQVNPAILSNVIAVAAQDGSSRPYALTSSGHLWTWDIQSASPVPQQVLPPTGYKFTSIAAGNNHAVAMLRAVPEPGTFVLTAAGLGPCFTRRRRRSRSKHVSGALAAMAAILVCASSAHASALRAVALRGQQAPGAPDGTVITGFDPFHAPVVLNDAGQTAFFAYDSAGLFPNNLGIWPEGSGGLKLVAAEGQQVPGLPESTTCSSFGDGPRIVLSDTGQTALVASVNGPGVSLGGGIWSNGPGWTHRHSTCQLRSLSSRWAWEECVYATHVIRVAWPTISNRALQERHARDSDQEQ